MRPLRTSRLLNEPLEQEREFPACEVGGFVACVIVAWLKHLAHDVALYIPSVSEEPLEQKEVITQGAQPSIHGSASSAQVIFNRGEHGACA